jgi:hypothetical protein
MPGSVSMMIFFGSAAMEVPGTGEVSTPMIYLTCWEDFHSGSSIPYPFLFYASKVVFGIFIFNIKIIYFLYYFIKII